MANIADFPIAFYVDHFDVVINGRTHPTNEPWGNRDGEIPAHADIIFSDHALNLNGLTEPRFFGTARYKVRYGRRGGAMREEATGRQRLEFNNGPLGLQMTVSPEIER